ncbi:MAG: glycoside hydrolase family 3 [Oscillospiraceae bacterium]|nr:glycoside hydrolase family 3 [Oscillospiraceae bacterium]
MCLLWKACKTHGTLGQGILMKSRKLGFILILACICTGCGREIEQAELPKETQPETVISETLSETAVSETALSVKSTVNSTTVTTKVSESGTETTTAGTTSKEIEAVTELLSTEIVQDAENPEETVIIYYYVSGGGSSGKKRTTVTSRATASHTTTHTTTVMTDPIIQTAPPETEPEVIETEPEVIHLTGNAWEILNQMTLRQKIYQMFIVRPELLTGAGTVTAAGTWTQECIYEQPVGGLVYFGDNLVSGGQTSQMLSNTQSYARDTGVGMFLAVDEEGGLVARCAKKLGTTKLNPMQEYGSRNDWNEAYWIGQTLGSEIQQFGFNLDFAPVADVNLNSGNELGNRIFSSDPYVVANMVDGVVKGIQSTGVAATLKHFPGLGAEDGNAHYDSQIIINRSLDELRNSEFVAFQFGVDAGADFVMVSHQIMTCAGDGIPSCLSHVVCTDWLRHELYFDGIIITDSFEMNTISGSYSPAESAVMAVEAGVDVILMPTDLTASVNAIEDAVNTGRISEERINESVYRILQEKEKMNLLG